MTISVTHICNMALSKIGANRISALSDGTKNSILCNDFYEATVDEVLRMHPWNCAISRAQLAPLSESPAFGYDYQYTLPTAPYCLRVLQTELDYEFKIEGRMLLTDESTCNILYIKRITDPTKFDPLLVEAIAVRLGMKLAYPVVQSKTLTEQLAQEYEWILREARSADAQEGSVAVLDTSTWLEARL